MSCASTAWTPFWTQDLCDILNSRLLSPKVEKNFRIVCEQLQVLLTALAMGVLLKKTQHSLDPSCTENGHVQVS